MQKNIIFQKYRYIKSLGHGGCAEVFLAENLALKNYWAIKEISKNGSASISGYLEPVILKRLNHPALPRIVDVHEDESKIYIIEDYIEGKSLLQVLENDGPCQEQKVTDWGMQLCSVLDYLHGQKPNAVIYGDMKPHNIILTQDGCIKLIDFGVSMYSGNGEIPASEGETEGFNTGFIGTRGYAAPEQYLGKGSSISTDIYSLGITLIQLLTGRHPLQCADFYSDSEYRECMPLELFEILNKCVQTKPSKRYSSVSQLRTDLGKVALYNVSRPPGSINTGRNSLTRIFAFSGVSGAGVSTITGAVAEYLAKTRKATVCIVDLSHSGALAKGYTTERAGIPSKPVKLDSKLFYINYRNFISPDSKNNNSSLKEYPIDHTDPLIIYKQFSQLQDQFSFILVDADLSILKMIEHVLSHIFLICDMNPYYISGLGERIEVKELASSCSSGTSFIVNKFYKGELSSGDILQGAISNDSTEEHLRKLISLSTLFEVPYDQWIYLKWMYSGFGEPLRFGGKSSDRFGMAVAHIVEKTIQPPKSQPWQGLKKITDKWSSSYEKKSNIKNNTYYYGNISNT